MKVIRCEVLGFCMGVRRAVELAVSEAEGGGRVYTLGPLIHNPAVLDDLESRGVQAIEYPPDNPEGCSVIIRAHGIDPRLEESLRATNCRIIDATCPNVKKSQLKAKDLVRSGYGLFIAGQERHAETAGILGYAGYYGQGEFCRVVSNAGEAEAAARGLYETGKSTKTALIGQTTISEEEYALIGEGIKKYFPDLLVVQTICAATRERQQALRELLNRTDAVIIAGGRESANTRCLLAIALNGGKPCTLAENAAEIPPTFRAYETVGICAGASTPDTVVDEIERELLSGKLWQE
jgi:4-hydroxy-3-methylbut-2-enyl diphosphate reductase